MLYYLSNFTDLFFGFNILRYITFRSGMAAVTTFLICMIWGPCVIRKLRKLKIQEIAKRDDCADLDRFQVSKEGTPTMGGIFIVGSVFISVLLWADLTNKFVLLTLLTAVYLAILGWIDDYRKLTRKGDKRGLSKRTKFWGQLGIGLLVGVFVYLNPATSTDLEFPFLKQFVVNLGIFYIPFVALVIVGASNAVNLTDGLDGLAIGCVLIVSMTFAILAYITGHMNFSQYLFIPFIPGAGELTIVCTALLGASLGFLWFNCHPASVFMGDVGSLSLGGTLGVIAVLIKKEILLALAGGVFVIEALSVILQVWSVKTRGKKLFKISPIHHHFQLSGWTESKIIIRFWIMGLILAMVTLMTLKIR